MGAIGAILRKVNASWLLVYGASCLVCLVPSICLADAATGEVYRASDTRAAPLPSNDANCLVAANKGTINRRAMPLPIIRVAIAAPVATGSFANLIEWLEQVVASQYDLVNHFEYQSYATRLSIKFPLSSRAAWRIAHVAHVSHVLVIRPASEADGASARLSLIDARSGELLLSFRHTTSPESWSESERHAFEQQFFRQIRCSSGPVPKTLPPVSSVLTAQPSVSPRTQDELFVPEPKVSSTSKNSSLPTGPVPPHQSRPTGVLEQIVKPLPKSGTSDVARKSNFGPTLQLAMGLAVGRRRATLHPHLLEAGTPPCFCKERGYSGAYPSLLVSGSLRRSGQKRHLGLAVATETGYSAQPSAAIHTGDSAGGVAFRLETLLFYQLGLHPTFFVRPEIGYYYRLFNVTDGPFLALSRGGPQASFTAHVTSPNQHLQTDARAGLQVFVHEGLESARLGHRKRGLGYFFEVAPRIQFNIFFAEIGFRFEQASLSYAGATALFDDAALRDVHLTDTVFGGFATAGLIL